MDTQQHTSPQQKDATMPNNKTKALNKPNLGPSTKSKDKKKPRKKSIEKIHNLQRCNTQDDGCK